MNAESRQDEGEREQDVAAHSAPADDGRLARAFPSPHWRLAGWISLAVVLLTAVMVLGYYYYFPSQLGPVQPIAFSHRVHVTDKQISCLMCHGGTIESAHAGVPPVETCMLCHSRIIVDHPQIASLTRYYDDRRPVPWARVNNLPDFVFFNHQAHVRAGFDCGRCHGNIAQMDRVNLVHEFRMGFCIQCHRDNNYSTDCLTCHR